MTQICFWVETKIFGITSSERYSIITQAWLQPHLVKPELSPNARYSLRSYGFSDRQRDMNLNASKFSGKENSFYELKFCFCVIKLTLFFFFFLLGTELADDIDHLHNHSFTITILQKVMLDTRDRNNMYVYWTLFFNIIWPAMSAHWHEGLKRKLFYFTTVCLNVWTSLIHLFAWLHFHSIFPSICQPSERSLSDWPTWMQSNHLGEKSKPKSWKIKDLSVMQLWFKFAYIQIFPLVKLFTVPCARQQSAVKSR